MRLTDKETKIKLSDTKRYDLQDHKMFTKLSQLEDIEEKINGVLIKICLFALNGGYYKGESPFTIPTHIGCEDILVNFVFSQFYCYDGDLILYFKDYGKTWALTKEELE